MTSIMSITVSAYRPDNTADNTAVHQIVIDELNEFSHASGWSGAVVEQYSLCDGIITITVVAGNTPVTIDDLRQFRKNQQPHQEKLTQPNS